MEVASAAESSYHNRLSGRSDEVCRREERLRPARPRRAFLVKPA